MNEVKSDTSKRHLSQINDHNRVNQVGEFENANINQRDYSVKIKSLNLSTSNQVHIEDDDMKYFDEFLFSAIDRLQTSCIHAESLLDRLEKSHLNIDCYLTEFQVSECFAIGTVI